MWNKKYKYLPFYDSSPKELQERVKGLVEVFGKPSYPEDVLDYEFLCEDLKTWLKIIEYFLEETEGDLPFFTVEIAEELVEFIPGTPPFFFIQGVLTELIMNPKKVISNIRKEKSGGWKYL